VIGKRSKKKPAAEEAVGVCCPSCGCGHAPVRETRKYAGGLTRRYRTCRHCGRRFTTTERVQGE